MIPFQKIFTLMIRTFSKPMVEYFKKKQKLHQGSIFGRIFIAFGRRIYIVENWVNHRILKTAKARKTNYKDGALLEKGIETFSEVILYGILLGLPFWELYKGQLSAQQKEQKLQNRLLNLDQKLSTVNKKISVVSELLTQMKSKVSAQDGAKFIVEQTKEINKAKNEKNISSEEVINEQDNKVDLVQNAIDIIAEEFQDAFDDFQLSQQASHVDAPGQHNDISSSEVEPEVAQFVESYEGADNLSTEDIQIDFGDSSSVQTSFDYSK